MELARINSIEYCIFCNIVNPPWDLNQKNELSSLIRFFVLCMEEYCSNCHNQYLAFQLLFYNITWWNVTLNLNTINMWKFQIIRLKPKAHKSNFFKKSFVSIVKWVCFISYYEYTRNMWCYIRVRGRYNCIIGSININWPQ